MAARRGSTMFGRRGSLIADPVEVPGGKSASLQGDAPKPSGGGGGKGGRRKSVAGGRRKSVAAGKEGRRKSVAATTPKDLGAANLESQSGAKIGGVMWARMPPKHPEVYEKGVVMEVTGTKVKVQLPNGSTEEYVITDLLPCNTESDLDDVCAMTYLSEAAVLDCVKERYEKKKIYTWTARILIAMNPFEYLPLYGDEFKAKYAELDPRNAPPHIFAIGETAYRAIARKGKYKNQAIIVSGESGSGKTVGNKLLMGYFAYRSGSASASKTTEEITQIMNDSNPVLEAFGNAKTTRNNNSSRFGKFQIMNFTEQGEIGTITIATYLLEKSRVTSIGDPERNYHAFYQLLAGGGSMLAEFELSPAIKDYYYLNQSNCHEVVGVDDKKEFDDMFAALQVVGATPTKCRELFQTLAAVLHLGNVVFEQGDSGDSTIKNPDVLAKASARLGLEPAGLGTTLTTRELKGPRGQGTITKGLSVAAAERGRDAISKAIFDKCFLWTVACTNQKIREVGEKGGMNVGDDAGEERFVGLVDLFGFEQFKINSFEQLCINFANETLQQFFLQYVFYTEEAIHKEEGVTWPAVELPDNQGAIDLIAKKDKGILHLLDGMSKLQGAKEGGFFEQVNDAHKKSRFYKKAKGLRNDEGFTVKHYAGDVTYHAGTFATGPEGVTWLDKNNYALAQDQQKALSASKLPLIAELFEAPGQEDAGGGDKKHKIPQVRSAGKAFIANLESLMTTLKQTSVQFVRCVKSCMEQQPGICTGKMVLNQLRCNGTMEAVEVMQAAYPSRIAYELIHGNVVKHLPEFMQKLAPNAFFEILMAALDIPREKYQLGLTKLFMKAGTGKALEELAEMDVEEMVPILLAKVQEFERKKTAGILIKKNAMCWQQRKRYQRIRLAALRIQKIHRSLTMRRKFLTLIRVCVEVHREMAAKQKAEEEERKRKQAELERQQAELKRAEEEMRKKKAAEAARASKAAEETKAAEDADAVAQESERVRKEKAELEKQKAELEIEAMEAEQAKADVADGFERILSGGMLQEPDIGDRLGDEEGGGRANDMMSRVSQRFQEIENERKTKIAEEMAALEEEDSESDYSDLDDDDDEEMTLNKAAGDDKVFEVVIVRHETTGSLGLELDEYKGAPTVCAIMLGGPADQDGTLQMGDTVVAIDGKPTHNMEDVKRAVISAASTSLRLAVLRKPVVVLRRERAYMNMPDVPEDEEWDQFEITLFSNRQLTFEKLSPPFVFGSIELPAAKSLRLMKVQYNVCLQIATAERSFEFYTDSLMTLYEWQRMLRSLMLSNTVSIMSGWLTLITNAETSLKRWWFDLCGSTYELCYYETDQCQALNLPAQGCIDLAEVRLVDAMDPQAIAPFIAERRPADGGELSELVRLMCDVSRVDETMPIGLELGPDFTITRFGAGSPAEVSSGQGGLQIGDRLLAVDGHEIDLGPLKNKKGKNKAVKELLRDLDAFPKQVHTFTVERKVPVVIQDTGALQVKAKGDHWILYPCSADEVPLSAEEYQSALGSWMTALRECSKEAREAKEGAGQEQILQQLWVELEDDDEWHPFYCTLTAASGLCFYDEKEDAQSTPDQPVKKLGLDHVRGAGRAPGIDFYDGVIDVEVYGFEAHLNDMWRIRPSGHAAMHNLLSAINIYKIPPTAEQLAEARGEQRQQTAKGNVSHRQDSRRDGGKSARGGGMLSFRSSGAVSARDERGDSGGGGGGLLSFRGLFGGGKKAQSKPSGGLEALPEESGGATSARRGSFFGGGRRPSSSGDANAKQRRPSKTGGFLSFRRKG